MIVRMPERAGGRRPDVRRLERQLERAQLYLDGALNTGEGDPDLRRRVDGLRRELESVLQDIRRRP